MSDQLKHLDDNSFENAISQGIAIIDFYADWCGPCRMMEPVIESLAEDLSGKATVAKVDIDASQGVTSNYHVTSIPTIIIFKDGQEKQRVVGVKDKEALMGIVNGL